ncbi:pentatricopeptide repeat-containing protein At3g02490, mitochondrial-like [Pistacia vera]|uniref:pentatricopeptide repeat-containing protein At3g02490, mitochondrial-like n=1 Tax=Pistacia vera TaxID=55513 RepID=UPI0012638B7C|nr:pentatricopeptide repeat-containing protein At3g02490, mitochondrial-like [Pistacia vera]XP_031279370.1 pentatricopeptide repeat-containing protein At3g02490, mitochondrial-like [Pistacia vera]
MRHQWRYLLFRKYPRSPLQFPTVPSSQVHSSLCNSLHESLRTLSSNIHTSTHYLSDTGSQRPSFYFHFKNPVKSKSSIVYKNPMSCSFSSEPAMELKDSDFMVVSDIFNKFSDVNDINKELESSGVLFTHEMVLKVLSNLESSPDVARRFFYWVSERESARLSSKSYNLMLKILGANGFIEEFWALVDAMKKKGYGVSGHVRNKMTEKFEKEGLDSDLEKLKGVFATGSIDNSIEKISSRVCKIVRSEVWGDDVEKRLRELNVTFSSDLVKFAVENLGDDPMKALIFFRWAEESGLVKHDGKSYNAMARVLGREDCIDRFWKVVDEMRSRGYQMEEETYVKVLGRFSKRKMVKDAVDLYEFAMAGKNKPSVQCCTFLLRKIVVAKQLDMGLFSKVVSVFTENGNILTDSMLNAVLKALTSVGRLGECKKIFQVMEKGGFVASGNMKSKIVFRLSSGGKKDEAGEFMDHVETSGSDLGHKTWVSLIEGHCVAGDLERASECFQKMVGKEGASCAGHAFELLVNAYCRKNRATDACKLVHDYVRENHLQPSHTTYKELTKKLLVQRRFEDALSLVGLMKSHGFPPFVDPFIDYVSKSGTGDDAIAFLKTMTSKRFPSTSVVLRLFEAFFQARRHSEAQDLLSRCPGYIRNHADVLNLFLVNKSSGGSAAAVAA